MSTTTENLGLFKYDPNTDGTNTFNIEQALNDNWDKLDAAVAAAQSADAYDESRSYAVGDYCLHDGTLYRCTTATAGEAWNAAHWAATTLAAELTRHVADTVSHVTKAERDAWNAKANAVHAARHASGGADPITPAAIGAATSNHTHSLASLGAAAANHTHTPAAIGAAASNHTHSLASLGAAKTVTLTCTVPVSWTASGSYYTQTVAVTGMLAADNPVADILPGTDHDANKLYAEAWGKVQSITTLAGKVTIWCTEAPAVAMPVQFKVVR